MLYLVSGTSRSGKTIIANRILQQKQIPYLSLDWLVMGFTNGLPEYGLHDKLFPDEIAEKLWKFLQAMLENMLWSEIDYVIEGEAILPELIADLPKQYPKQIRICFVGYCDISIEDKVSDIKQHSDGRLDWLTQESDEYIERHVGNMLTHSRRIKADCAKYNFTYFDTSANFPAAIDEAVHYLLGDD